MILVYLSPVPWHSFAQRPHKFVTWFHERTGQAVVWVEPYPVRFPSWRDIRRIRKSESKIFSDQIPTWLTLVSPGGLPIEPLPCSAGINKFVWLNVFRRLASYLEREKVFFVFGKPSVLALTLMRLFPTCPTLYDAMDEFPEFHAGISRWALSRRERELVRNVDVVLASSSALKKHWSKFHADVRLVLNGLDVAAVHSVQRKRMQASGKKIFGYLGTIAAWFDWHWIVCLAKTRPNDEIRLIGPAYVPLPKKLPKNITFFPACEHSAAIVAMSQFDVGIIPFINNSLTRSVDPIKYYEYRSLGLPVISTYFGEMGLRANVQGVFVTRSVDDLRDAIDLAIDYHDDPGSSVEFACSNSWAARFDAANLGHFYKS